MLLEAIRDNPTFRRFVIGDSVFAKYTCPLVERALPIWTHTDHLVHVISGRKTWRNLDRAWVAEPGQTFFFRKGAFLLEQDFEEDFCAHVFFLPDSFVQESLVSLATELPALDRTESLADPALELEEDAVLAAFLQSMAVYFASDDDPPPSLLRLKLQELIVSLVHGARNRPLAMYLCALREQSRPPIAAIMETSYWHNLPLVDFARMSHRSLSTFKRDFREHYGMPPGRWLVQKRLERAAHLLRTSALTVTEIAFECGFEDSSHFGKAFKRHYRCSPTAHREETLS